MEENNKIINLLYTLDTPKPPEDGEELTGVRKLIKEDIVKLLTAIPAGKIQEVFKDLNLEMLDHAFVISIYGSWGSGKTTLIKRIEEDLRDTVEFFPFSLWDHSGGNIRKSFLTWLGKEIESRFRKQREDEVKQVEEILTKKPPEELDNYYTEAKDFVKAQSTILTFPKNKTLEHKAGALHRLHYLIGLVAGTHKKVETRSYRRPNYLALVLIGISLLLGSAFITALYDGILQANSDSLGRAIIEGATFGLLTGLIAGLIVGLISWLSGKITAKSPDLLYGILSSLTIMSLTIFRPALQNIPYIGHFLKFPTTDFPTIYRLLLFSSGIATVGLVYLLLKIISSSHTNPLDIIFSSNEKEEIEQTATISEIATDFRKIFFEMLFSIRPILTGDYLVKPAVIVIDDLDRLQPEDAHKMLNEMRVFTSLSDIPQDILPQHISPETIKTHLFFIIPISVGTFEAAHLDEKFFNKLFFLSYTLPTPSLPEKFEQLKNLTVDIAELIATKTGNTAEKTSVDSIASLILSTSKIVYTFSKTRQHPEEQSEKSRQSSPEEYYDEITMRDLKKIVNHIAFNINAILGDKVSDRKHPSSHLSFVEILAILFFASLQVLGKIETPSDVIELTEYLRKRAQQGKLEWLSPSLVDKLHFYMLNLYHTSLTNPTEKGQESPVVEELKLILTNPPSPKLSQETSEKQTTDSVNTIIQHIEKLLGKKVLSTDSEIMDAISRAILLTIDYWTKANRLPSSPTFIHLIHLIEQIKTKIPQDIANTHPAYIIAERIEQSIKTLSPGQLETILQKAFREINTPTRLPEINIVVELLAKYIQNGVIPTGIVLRAALKTVSSIKPSPRKNTELIPLIIAKKITEMVSERHDLIQTPSNYSEENDIHISILKSAYMRASTNKHEQVFTISDFLPEPIPITKLSISPITHISTHSGKEIAKEIGHIFWEPSKKVTSPTIPAWSSYNLSEFQKNAMALLTFSDQLSELMPLTETE